MKLYHATPKSNLDSIFADGLDPAFSTGKAKVIWLHTKSRRHWAIAHVQKRHRCNLDEVVLIEVNVPRSRLQRRWRGLWTTTETLMEFTITEAAELAASPITEA